MASAPPELDEALPEEVAAPALVDEAPQSPAEKLMALAGASGDISGMFDAEYLSRIGSRVVDDYERDKADRKDWADVARDALLACSQEEVRKAKDTPWPNASNMRYPLLTSAALQFNARMYPAVVKGDEAVLCKVIGNDNGQPKMAPNPVHGQMQPVPKMDEQTGQPVEPLQPDWAVEPGAKAKRARRVADYMNYQLFYKMDNWEGDTDQLLIQLPAVGCMFRKVWTDPTVGPCTATVSALRLLVPDGTRSLKAALRITEELPDVYPHEIQEKQLSGYYSPAADLALAKATDRNATSASEENDGARLLLECHCRWDFDGDDLPEPYIITVDHETRTVLRIEPDFAPDSITWADIEQEAEDETGAAVRVVNRVPIRIEARQYYVKYGMFPHPEGKFYDIGLGHLLKRLGDVIDTAINQLLDAGNAQTAGGGFIGAGVRLQSRGNRGTIRFTPGEWKTVDVSGDTLRANMVEKTLPNVSPVTFQVLEMIMGAAKDIAGAKDVITGDASNTGQVGTTLALIEQGLQVFNATAKRVFRNLKDEYELIYENDARYGEQWGAPQDYAETLDDPEADFASDFALDRRKDIRPISDPSNITRIQKMARAQFLLGLAPGLAQVGGDPREVYRRVLEAVDTEDIDKLLPPPPPADPQKQMLEMQTLLQQLRGLAAKASKDEAGAQASNAKAMLDAVNAAQARFDLANAAGQHGMVMGAMAHDAATPGALNGLEIAAENINGQPAQRTGNMGQA